MLLLVTLSSWSVPVGFLSVPGWLVKPIEIIASHILVQCLVMSIQTALTLVTAVNLFSIPCLGPIHWLSIIVLLQGLAGMSFGFLISALCDSQAVAMQLSTGFHSREGLDRRIR